MRRELAARDALLALAILRAMREGPPQITLRELRRALELNPKDNATIYKLLCRLRRAGLIQEAGRLRTFAPRVPLILWCLPARFH